MGSVVFTRDFLTGSEWMEIVGFRWSAFVSVHAVGF